MKLKELTDIPHTNDTLIMLADGSINVTADSEVELSPFRQADGKHVFMSCAKYRAMFARKMNMSFDEATDEQKLEGLNKILDNWTGVEYAAPKVTFRQKV